jgi:hypothetical protein
MSVYTERAHLVAVLARIYPSHGYQPTDAEEGYQYAVCIHFPWGQGAWHIADNDFRNLFASWLLHTKRRLRRPHDHREIRQHAPSRARQRCAGVQRRRAIAMSDKNTFISIGDALAQQPLRRNPVMAGAAVEAQITLTLKSGATLRLTAKEAADAGLHCTGSGEERICQFGLWRDSRGEWVYPPEHDPTDLDGYRYRQALHELEQAHRVDMQSKARQPKTPRYSPVDPFSE